MKKLRKKVLFIAVMLIGVFLGGIGMVDGDAQALVGTDGDSCYSLHWYTTVTSTTSYHSGRNQMEAGGGTGNQGQETSNPHDSNRVCYNVNNQAIYTEKITNDEAMALGVSGDDLCLLHRQGDGTYKPKKCINDWKNGSGNGIDTSKLTGLLRMAGADGVEIGEGTAGAGPRGVDFSEADDLGLSNEQLNDLRNVTALDVNIVEEQQNQEQEAHDQEAQADDEDSSIIQSCAGSGGAGALGWIVCPIMEFLSGAAEYVYTEFIEPSLQVNTNLFTGGSNSTREAWEIFRNMANVVFIIMLLWVIFSQLTGYGIDNFGIKKILPKLIIGVFLMNLSYLICILCVDLSNIVGSGMKSLLDGLPPDITGQEMSIDGADATFSATAKTGISVALLGLLGSGAIVSLLANPAILLSLLVSAVGISISMFFLFVLLSARQAAVVVLTVISPLAFATFMLPNMKKYFDKWLKFMQAMLLLYPIAGLLVGGGNYASRLLLSASGGNLSFMMALMSMLIGVVPILFIPSVMKSSFAAMGKAGAMLTGVGKQASRSATGAIRRSEGYKNAQNMGLERRTRFKAGLDKNGKPTAIGRRKAKFAQSGFGKAIGANKRLNAYTMAAQRNIAAGTEADAAQMAALAISEIPGAKPIKPDPSDPDNKKSLLGNSFGKGTKGAYYGDKFLKAASKGDTSGMEAALTAMKSSGMRDKDISKFVRHAYNEGAINLDDNTRRDFSEKLAGKFGDTFASDYELKHFLQSGASGVLGDYGDRFGDNNTIDHSDMKPEDFMRMSGDSLAAAATQGFLTQGIAKQIRARNPNLSEDKQIMVGAVADGKTNFNNNTSYKDFKSDAEALMKNHGATVREDGNNISTFAHYNDKDVDRWVAPAVSKVEMVDSSDASGAPGGTLGGAPGGVPGGTPTGGAPTGGGSTGGGAGDVPGGVPGGGAGGNSVLSSVTGVYSKSMHDYSQGGGDQAVAQDKIYAAQRDLVKTDAGRQAIQQSLEGAVTAGDFGGAREAATNLQQHHIGKFSSDGGGGAQLINDLAGGVEDNVIKQRVSSGYYSGGSSNGASGNSNSVPSSGSDFSSFSSTSGNEILTINHGSSQNQNFQYQQSSNNNGDVSPQAPNVQHADVPPQAPNVQHVDVPSQAPNVQHVDVPPQAPNAQHVDVPDSNSSTPERTTTSFVVNGGTYIANDSAHAANGGTHDVGSGTLPVKHNESRTAGQRMLKRWSNERLLEQATKPNGPKALGRAAEAELLRRDPNINK